jgi:hypothetical protein
MNITIVKEDKVVMIDGEGMNFDFDLPTNVWAIQWNGSTGEIEFNDGTPNEAITDFSAYQGLVDGHATEKQRLADVAVQEEADRIANMTTVLMVGKLLSKQLKTHILRRLSNGNNYFRLGDNLGKHCRRYDNQR